MDETWRLEATSLSSIPVPSFPARFQLKAPSKRWKLVFYSAREKKTNKKKTPSLDAAPIFMDCKVLHLSVPVSVELSHILQVISW